MKQENKGDQWKLKKNRDMGGKLNFKQDIQLEASL